MRFSPRLAQFFSSPIKQWVRSNLGVIGIGIGIGLGWMAGGLMDGGGIPDYKNKDIWQPISGYERSVDMRQLDQSALRNLYETLQTDPKWQQIDANWENMTPTAQVEALREVSALFLENYAEIGIKPVPIVTYEEAPFELDGKTYTTGGLYRHGEWGRTSDARISYNIHPETIAERDGDFEEAVGTIVHETTHGIGYQLADRLVFQQLGSVPEGLMEDAIAFQRARLHYVSHSEDIDAYHSNPLEINAFSNGTCFEIALRMGPDVERRLGTLSDPVNALISVCMNKHEPGRSPSVSDAEIREEARNNPPMSHMPTRNSGAGM